MNCHKKISFFQTPIVWLKDKTKTGLNSPGIYIIGLLPSVFLIVGLIADLTALFRLDHTLLFVLILIFLFVYGLINLGLVFFLQRNNIRLHRTRNYFDLFHKCVILKFREYIIAFDADQRMPKDRKIKYIKDILTQFNNSFMKDLHGKETVITLKYQSGNQLIPIRAGENLANRSETAEELKESYIYTALNKPRNRTDYIYVKNINKPDKLELQTIGQDLVDIQRRALPHYSTFIAVPIRSTDVQEFTKGDFHLKKDLGMLGIDLNKKYGFGNLEKYELNIIYCLADLLSVIVEDIIKQE
jgi:hypothetical protein